MYHTHDVVHGIWTIFLNWRSLWEANGATLNLVPELAFIKDLHTSTGALSAHIHLSKYVVSIYKALRMAIEKKPL